MEQMQIKNMRTRNQMKIQLVTKLRKTIDKLEESVLLRTTSSKIK